MPKCKPVCPLCKRSDYLSLKGNESRRLSGSVSFEDMAQITLDAIGDAVLVIDPQGRVIYLNRVAESLTGWTSDDALGCAIGEVFFVLNGVTRQRAINPAQRAIQEQRTVDLALGSILIRRDGTHLAIEDSAAPIINHAGQIEGAVIVFHDARQSGAEIQKMSHLAQHDVLTGLPNRMLLMERLTQAIGMARRHQKQIALLFVDLDNFKDVNDAFGHSIGDQLLQTVAERIVSCVRVTDTVSRYGGDEFVILLTEIENREDAAHIAEKLLSKFSIPSWIDSQSVKLTLSIGISVYPENGSDADTLMKNSDMAMYTIKENGRNSYQFFERSS